jgi:hypothetical protein
LPVPNRWRSFNRLGIATNAEARGPDNFRRKTIPEETLPPITQGWAHFPLYHLPNSAADTRTAKTLTEFT